MTNEQMTEKRYLRWFRARRLVSDIEQHLAAGGRVAVATYTRVVVYTPKHADMFKATRTGAYVQRGKSWDCIDYCTIQFLVRTAA